jgi:hypothetical protein
MLDRRVTCDTCDDASELVASRLSEWHEYSDEDVEMVERCLEFLAS